MPYVYDYVTEEEFNKYELSKYPLYKGKEYHKYRAGGNIDREIESFLIKIQLPNKDGEGNVRYVFIIKDIHIEFDYNSKSEYIDENGNILNDWDFGNKKYPKHQTELVILTDISNKELCIKYKDLILKAFFDPIPEWFDEERRNIPTKVSIMLGE